MASKSLLQKEIKKYVIAQIQASSIELKEVLGEEKLNKRIKKAAKLIVEGIDKPKKEDASALQEEKNAAPFKENEIKVPKPPGKTTVQSKTMEKNQ